MSCSDKKTKDPGKETEVRCEKSSQRTSHTDDGGRFSKIVGSQGEMCGLFVALGCMIWLVATSMAGTFNLTPIWLGAITLGVIAGFVHGGKTAGRISDELLASMPLVEVKMGKSARLRVSGDFLKTKLGRTGGIPLLFGVTAIYCTALAVWNLFLAGAPVTFFEVCLSSVAGLILGTIAGRRVFRWQCENRLIERADPYESSPLSAPNIALGFSIPVQIAMAGIWIAMMIRSPGNWDAVTNTGFDHYPGERHQASGVVGIPITGKTPVALAEPEKSEMTTGVAFFYTGRNNDKLFYTTLENQQGEVCALPENFSGLLLCGRDGSILFHTGDSYSFPPEQAGLTWVDMDQNVRFSVKSDMVSGVLSENGRFLAYSRIIPGTGSGMGFRSEKPNDHPRSEIVIRDISGSERVVVENKDLPIGKEFPSLSPSVWSGSEPAGLSSDGNHLLFHRDYVYSQSGNRSGILLFHTDVISGKTQPVVVG